MKTFSLSSRYIIAKKTEIKEKPVPKSNYFNCYNVFLKTCLDDSKTVFLFCDNYIVMTYFAQVDTRLKGFMLK